MFTTVLIANRGEIAVRVARACRELGIRVVAVYSTEDRDSAVVRSADATVHIGPGPSRQSYLNIPAVIEAALMTGAEAIHPGYGFLSEDPDFAEVCEANGLTLIGPPADVLASLGNKAVARALMMKAGLPLLPGGVDPVGAADGERLAAEITYPVIIKAVAGGGGRGMRVVRDPGDFPSAYRETQAAAQVIFGDGRVYVERYLDFARHVEIQILADRYGNAVHFGDRDCSVQRRHQKLIEESPAYGLPEGLADRMGEAAVRAALEVGYVGAGTFEFLVDAAGDFSFMEVNSRIQVEHPVTEMVTGIDLVREQIRIAAGEPLGYRQHDVRPRGAAIECRINVEDPERGFLPTPGTITEFTPPGGPFVRVDTHAYPGYRVPAAYDSLLAKLIVWGPDRPQAVARMRRALDEFRVAGPGVHSTVDFLRRVVASAPFTAGGYGTNILADLQDG